jgi:LysM repeat protein
MSRCPTPVSAPSRRVASTLAVAAIALAAASVHAVNYPVTPQQRSTAQQVAQAGVPLSELAPNAPDQYTVKRRDTLWDISSMFLRSPWRWPELWGMNLDQIRNPHLIYPGQVLVLDKSGGRARLRVAGPDGTTRLSPRIRSSGVGDDAIASIPFGIIEPFLNEAIVFNTDELNAAPRIVAAPENRVMMGKGDLAYVRGGELGGARNYRIFREAKPLRDPTTQEVLGYEAFFVGSADYLRSGESRPGADGGTEVASTFQVTDVKREAGVGDRLTVVPSREYSNYAPHAPSGAMNGQIVSIYGDGVNAGQYQIVALNKGAADGMERGHVLALWRAGKPQVDRTDGSRATVKLPDERNGMLFVFRTFERVSYALILSGTHPASVGDYFSQP